MADPRARLTPAPGAPSTSQRSTRSSSVSRVSDRHAAHPLLRDLEAAIGAREPGPRGERLAGLGRALLARTLHERLRTFDLEEVYRQVAELYDFADARG